MMQAPTLAAIYSAELRVAQSKQNTQNGLRRVRVAFRATLAKPSTLALAAGVAGLFGFWLARRPLRTSSSDRVGVTTTASTSGHVRVFIVRYAMQHLPFILKKIWAALQKRTLSAGPVMSKPPATDYPATSMLH